MEEKSKLCQKTKVEWYVLQILAGVPVKFSKDLPLINTRRILAPYRVAINYSLNIFLFYGSAFAGSNKEMNRREEVVNAIIDAFGYDVSLL